MSDRSVRFTQGDGAIGQHRSVEISGAGPAQCSRVLTPRRPAMQWGPAPLSDDRSVGRRSAVVPRRPCPAPSQRRRRRASGQPPCGGGATRLLTGHPSPAKALVSGHVRELELVRVKLARRVAFAAIDPRQVAVEAATTAAAVPVAGRAVALDVRSRATTTTSCGRGRAAQVTAAAAVHVGGFSSVRHSESSSGTSAARPRPRRAVERRQGRLRGLHSHGDDGPCPSAG